MVYCFHGRKVFSYIIKLDLLCKCVPTESISKYFSLSSIIDYKTFSITLSFLKAFQM